MCPCRAPAPLLCLLLIFIFINSSFSSPRIYGFIMRVSCAIIARRAVHKWSLPAPVTTPMVAGSIQLHCWCNTRLDGVFWTLPLIIRTMPHMTMPWKWSNLALTIIGNYVFKKSFNYKAFLWTERASVGHLTVDLRNEKNRTLIVRETLIKFHNLLTIADLWLPPTDPRAESEQ